MKQTYHSNSTTNVRLRTEINKSNLPQHLLEPQYGITQNTINKWKSRTKFQDKNSRPHTINYSLSKLDMLIAIRLRILIW